MLDEALGEGVWSVDTGAPLLKPYCFPVIARSLFFFGAEDGSVVALDLASGQRAWQRSLGEGNIAMALATDGTRVFLGPEDVRPIPTPGKAFLALDARSGEEVWQYPTEAHSLSGAALAEKRLYFTSADGQLHALDATSGQKLWAARHPEWGPAPPAVAGGIVCAGGRGETLVAYAATDGKELWRFSAGGWFATQPSIVDGCIYALCWDDHLYALDSHSGEILWKLKGERGKGLTTPLTVSDGRVFFGSRVYREVDGQRTGTYAMVALKTENGEELWRFHTERHIFTPPAVADGVLFLGSADGVFYALDAASGKEGWRATVKSRVVTEPQVSGDVVYVGERDGTIYAIRWRVIPRKEQLAPQVYEQQGQYVEAAAAYGLGGEFEAAAAIYESALDKPYEAAQLYERAGQPGKAAPLWARLGDLKRARDMYGKAEDKLGLAKTLEQMKEPLAAARLYEEMVILDRAALLYEQIGDRAKAAELYSQSGDFEKARAIWESLGDWEKAVNTLVVEGRLAEAAQILEEQNRSERAADLYEQAGQPEKALNIQVKLECWDKVAELASVMGDYQLEGEAQEKLGHPKRAANAYEQAAEQLLATEAADEEQVATLYEQAARLYAGAFEEERATACLRQVRRYRRLPEITLQGEAQDAFVEYQWNTLRLRVENTGYGAAHSIVIELRGEFDVEGECSIEGLAPQKTRSLELFARTHKDHYGPKVPLQIIVTYKDLKGSQYEITKRLAVRVTQQGISPGTITPMEIQMQSDLIQPDLAGARRTAVIRDLLSDAYSDEELTTLCFDHFPAVYEGLGSGMSKPQKIQRLVEYCERQLLFDQLLALVREHNPAQFARFETQLGFGGETENTIRF